MISHLQQLAKKYPTRDYSSGSVVLYQGEVPRTAFILLEGVVRGYTISSRGEEQIVTFHVAGEFFPLSWCFGKASSTIVFYEAITDCKIALCPRKELANFMLNDDKRMRSLIDYLITNYSSLILRVHALEQSKARDKLVNTLYFLSQRYANKSKDGTSSNKKVEIPVNLTHQSLASLVGLTRETTAVEMNKLKNEKVINYNQQRYMVDVARLLELTGEESFRNIMISNDD